MVSFEIFVKAMLPSLSESKVLPSFCFAFKIPDDRAASSMYAYGIYAYGMYAYGMYAYSMYAYGMYTYGLYNYETFNKFI